MNRFRNNNWNFRKTSIKLRPLDSPHGYGESLKKMDKILSKASSYLEDTDFQKSLKKIDKIPEEYKKKKTCQNKKK